MKKNILLSLSLFFSFSLIAQVEFAPEGAEWYYRTYFGWLGPGATHVKVTGDTAVANLSYKKLTIRSVTDQHEFFQDIFLRQEGDRVYRFDENGDYLLFELEMEVGEVHSYPAFNYPNSEFEVMSVEITDVNGHAVREHLLEWTDNNDYQVRIYDRYGPEYGFFDGWLGSAVDGNDHYLQCYSDGEIGEVKLTNDECGDGLINSVGEATVTALPVYPNPVGDVLTVALPADWPAQTGLTAFDALGRSFSLQMENGQITVGQLAAGIYTGRIGWGEQVWQFRFVKK